MLKKLASDALGLSDIGAVISPADYDKTEVDDYIFHEINEKPIFVLKSRSDEYCFTNLALIHVDGTSAISKKRTLRRYDYEFNQITEVLYESAGSLDLDIELKLCIGETYLSIDIHKKFIEEVKDLYKALHAISVIQRNDLEKLSFAQQSIDIAARAVDGSRGETPAWESFAKIAGFTNDWLNKTRSELRKKDFAPVFELYINN